MIIQPLIGGTPRPRSTSGGTIRPLIESSSPVLTRQPKQQQVVQVTPDQKKIDLGKIASGAKQFAARTAVGFADLISEGLDFSVNFIANNPILVGKAVTGKLPKYISELVTKKETPQIKREKEIENKWKDIYNKKTQEGKVPTMKLKQTIDKIQENDYIKPSTEWTNAPIKEKLTKRLGETLAVLGPNIIPSFVLYAVNPAVGVGTTITSTANAIKNDAIKNGVETSKAELLGLGSGILVGALDRIVPDDLFSPSVKSKFIGNFIKRVATLTLKESGTEMAQEDIQILAEKTFREDLGWDEVKTRNIMSAFGGFLGGAGASTIVGTVNNVWKADILETIPKTETLKSTTEAPKLEENVDLGTKTKVETAPVASPTETKGGRPITYVDDNSQQQVINKISSERIKSTKDLKDVKGILSNIKTEVEQLTVEAEGKSIVAKEKRSGLNTDKIAKLKRIVKQTKSFQEGDIETIHKSQHSELLNDVLQNVQETHPEMTEQEAFDYAMELPNKSEEAVKKPEELKVLLEKQKKLDEYVKILKGKQSELALKEDEAVRKQWTEVLSAQENLAKIIEVSRGQLPVGEGKEKVSRLEARVTESLEKTSQEAKEKLGLSTFNQMVKKDQIQLASEYVSNKPDEAFKVLTGEIEAPKGLLRNSIYVAMENQARDNADLARKLSSLSSTRFGQELSILTEIDPDSPVSIMRDIVKVREETFEKKYGKRKASEVIKKEVENIRKEIKAPTKYDWSAFLDEIEC